MSDARKQLALGEIVVRPLDLTPLLQRLRDDHVSVFAGLCESIQEGQRRFIEGISASVVAQQLVFNENLLRSARKQMESFARSIERALPDPTVSLQKLILDSASNLQDWVENARELTPRAAASAFEALKRKDPQTVRRFFREFLDLDPTPANLSAFYRILGRSDRWKQVDGFKLLVYLSAAVSREGKRIQRGWDNDGVLRGRAKERERRAALEFARARARPVRPDRALMKSEAQRFRRLALEGLRESGTDRDREILACLEQGMSPAEIVDTLGLKWSAWQAFQRKAQRFRERARASTKARLSSNHSRVA